MTTAQRFRLECLRLPPGVLDLAIAMALVGGYAAWLLATVHDLGYARDEGFYFHAAGAYEQWFALLFSDPRAAIQREVVDRFWHVNHEHPALMKSLFALSHRYLYERWQWFATPGTAYRFPGIVVSSLAMGVVFAWGRLVVGRGAGVVAALLLAWQPRVFYHSHLACFDMPVASLWVLTTFVYWLSLTKRQWGWALAAGLCYGLLLDTKHNAWILPFALGAHWLVTQTSVWAVQRRWGAISIPRAWLAMALLGPIVLYVAWPWLWFDTSARLVEWYRFHTGHEYYNMEFLGHTYWKPPMPLSYSWVMTAATVPLVTLVLCLVGLGAFTVFALRSRAGARLVAGVAGTPGGPALYHVGALWLLCLAVSYAPWLSSRTPIFGGTKHWMTAYPFLCLFAGWGFAEGAAGLRTLAARWGRPRLERATPVLLAGCVLVGPLVMTRQSHPWGLSAYTPLVGGAPGAATLGLNRTFWGYTTGAVAGFLNARVRPRGAVYLHDTALQSFRMMVEDGRLRSDLQGTLQISGSDAALYHHEPHMSRVEHQIWVLYGTTTPAYVGSYQGVPVVWVYLPPGEGGP